MANSSELVLNKAKETAASIDQKEKSLGLEHIANMSPDKIVEAVGANANAAAYAVSARPELVGGMLQIAITGAKPAAILLLAATRYGLKNYSVDRVRAVNSVVRLTGEGAESVKESLRAVLNEIGVLGFDGEIKFSEQSPAQGALLANAIDRPDDCVAQLLADSVDASKLASDAKVIAYLAESSPQLVQTLVDTIGQSKDPRITTVKTALLLEMDDRVAGDIGDIKRGRNAQDGPYAHAKRMVPLISALLFQPDMLMKTLNVRDRKYGQEVDLETILRHCLYRGWTDETRKQVADGAAKAATNLLVKSLRESDKIQRDGESARTADFMATVVNVEAHEFDDKAVKKTLELLNNIMAMIPGELAAEESSKFALKVATGTIKSLGLRKEDGSQQAKWTHDAINDIMRLVYEAQYPAPVNLPSDSPAVTSYENAYAEWATTPLNTYDVRLPKE